MILPWQKQKWWQISRKCRLSFLDFSRLFCRNSFIQSYKCKYFLYTFNILPNIFVYQIKVNIGWIRCLWIFLLINIDPKVSIIFMIKLCFFMLQSTCSVDIQYCFSSDEKESHVIFIWAKIFVVNCNFSHTSFIQYSALLI